VERPSIVFESLRKSLNDLLARATPPEERREVVSRMRDTLVQAKMGLQDLRDGLAKSRKRLEAEKQEAETVQRRKRLAEQIGDAETVRIATEYEALHTQKIDVLSRKLEAQESELALPEQERSVDVDVPDHADVPFAPGTQVGLLPRHARVFAQE